MVDSITFTEDEAEDLVNVLRRALDEGTGYGHYAPDEPEYIARVKIRESALGKIQRPLERALKRQKFLEKKRKGTP